MSTMTAERTETIEVPLAKSSGTQPLRYGLRGVRWSILGGTYRFSGVATLSVCEECGGTLFLGECVVSYRSDGTSTADPAYREPMVGWSHLRCWPEVFDELEPLRSTAGKGKGTCFPTPKRAKDYERTDFALSPLTAATLDRVMRREEEPPARLGGRDRDIVASAKALVRELGAPLVTRILESTEGVGRCQHGDCGRFGLIGDFCHGDPMPQAVQSSGQLSFI